jgi:hypothetical protein
LFLVQLIELTSSFACRRLRLQRRGIETDVENVLVVRGFRRRGIGDVLGNKAELGVLAFHGYGCPNRFGHDDLLRRTILNHRDTHRNIYRGRRARRPGNDPAHDANSRGHLPALQIAVTRSARDIALIAQIVSRSRLARRPTESVDAP